MKAPGSARLATLQQLAREVGVPASTLRDALLRGAFEHVKFNRRLYVVRASFEAWLHAQTRRGVE